MTVGIIKRAIERVKLARQTKLLKELHKKYLDDLKKEIKANTKEVQP